MKKKIIIVSDSFRIGGIQKSLLNLLNNIDYTKWDVTLFVFNDGKIKNININKNINIISSNIWLRLAGMTSGEVKEKNILYYAIRKFLALACKIFGSQFVFNQLFKTININEKYDIAISYSNNVDNKSLYYGYNKFVLEKINAIKKISWVHIDYICRERKEWELNEFKQFDKIVLVSNECKKNFDLLYPSLKDKTTVVYNFVNESEILKLSQKDIKDINLSKNIILGIGRLEKNKNFELQLEIAKKLNERKIDFKWYIIGDGDNKNYLQNLIKNYNLEDKIYLLGSRDNVFPYLKNAKVFVSTSLTESFGLVIAEALILNTPVVALNYPALHELINDENGIICDSKDEMINEVTHLLTNEKYYKMIKEKSKYKIKNKTIIKQLDTLFIEGD